MRITVRSITRDYSVLQSLQTELGDKMDLSSYLLKPVQRMGKYALILKQILKECPESAAEYQDLTAAQDMIKFCLQHGNDLLAMDALKVSGGGNSEMTILTVLIEKLQLQLLQLFFRLMCFYYF